MENIQLVIIKDGVALEPILMPEGKTHPIYLENITFYNSGWAMSEDGIKAEYKYSIQLERKKGKSDRDS